jgi:hypothetical protein
MPQKLCGWSEKKALPEEPESLPTCCGGDKIDKNHLISYYYLQRRADKRPPSAATCGRGRGSEEIFYLIKKYKLKTRHQQTML